MKKEGHICIICNIRKSGNTKPGLICAGCYLNINRNKKAIKNWKRYKNGEAKSLIYEALKFE